MKKTLSLSLLTLAVMSATSVAYAETHDYTSTFTLYSRAQQHSFDLSNIENNLFRVVTAGSNRAFWHQTTNAFSIVGQDQDGELIGTVHLESEGHRALVANSTSSGQSVIKADTVTLLGGGSFTLDAYGSVSIVANNLTIGGTANYGLGTNASTAMVEIDANNTVIKGKTAAIQAAHGGSIELTTGDLTISAPYAIYSSGDSSANVNATGVANVSGDVSVTGTSDVSLSIAEGLFNGSFVTSTNGEGNLTLGEDAVWTVGSKENSLTTLNSSGMIDMSKTDASIVVTDSFAGNVIKVDATKTNTLTAEGEVTGSVSVVTDQDADTVTQAQAAAMVTRMSGVEATAYVKEGMYNGEMNVGAGGAVSTAANSLMSNVLDLASVQSVSMNRIMMNDVRKRLGDLRAAEGTHGVWARYDGGKLSGSNEYENDFTTVQVGIDTVPVADAPRFGVAFAYTTSDAEMKRGGADMDAFSLAFYGTKMYDNGLFVDVIGRMATADTDVVVDGDKKGAMDNVVLSLSGELGWRFDLTDKFYFEPQAELTYTYVNAETLALSSGHEYKFDAVDSLVGRVGFAAGFKCPNNFGDVYVRASAVHEFLGDATVRGGSAIHDVDGKDTWVEFGIGANFNVNKNTYVYADVERTEGANLEEDWRANVGVRFAF